MLSFVWPERNVTVCGYTTICETLRTQSAVDCVSHYQSVPTARIPLIFLLSSIPQTISCHPTLCLCLAIHLYQLSHLKNLLDSKINTLAKVKQFLQETTLEKLQSLHLRKKILKKKSFWVLKKFLSLLEWPSQTHTHIYTYIHTCMYIYIYIYIYIHSNSSHKQVEKQDHFLAKFRILLHLDRLLHLGKRP